MEKILKKGLFITFDGPDGCGKSTQSRLMAEELDREGYGVVYTSEPGGTGLGERIREVLLHKEDINLTEKAELLLFEADRAQHVEEIIRPAIEKKRIVICDRFSSATFAYQGYGLGMDMDLIKSVDEVSRGGVEPDITIILDLEAETGLERAAKEGTPDRMEVRGEDFHKRVRKGFLELAGQNPDVMKVISVRDTIQETFRFVKKEVYEVIERYKGPGNGR